MWIAITLRVIYHVHLTPKVDGRDKYREVDCFERYMVSANFIVNRTKHTCPFRHFEGSVSFEKTFIVRVRQFV